MKELSLGMIRERIPGFKEFRRGNEGIAWFENKEYRLKMTREIVGAENLPSLDEPSLEKLVGSLWANLMWPNISSKMKMILAANEFESIKAKLRQLIYGSEPLETRFDDFRESISHIGTAAITEILAFTSPKEYSPWNEKTRTAIKILDLIDIFPNRALKYSQIYGEDYQQCIESLREVLNVLHENGFSEADFLDLHYFLAWIVDSHLDAEAIDHEDMEISTFEDFNHDEIGELVALIGSNLGFEAETKRKIARGSMLDAYWSARVGNMGEIAYAFEVQKSGSIDSLIVNLQRARNDPKVQRIVVISTEAGLQEIRDEIETLQGDFKRYLAYLDVKDVIRAAQLLREVNEILQNLRLSSGAESGS